MATVALGESPGGSRPLRADARRNRARVLDAARRVFADHGHEAQMDEIARAAEVGVGTVYRHFPTKEGLIAALVADSFERIDAAATLALEADDPWDAFSGVLWYGAELLASNRGLTEALAVLPDHGAGPLVQRVNTTFTELIGRAQAAGVVRPDLCADDVSMVMCGVGAATRKPHPCRDSWRRHLSILLDGMRAQAATGKLPD